ncbi:DEAD/DEAH box helicase [Aerococcus kribbianus]|uniref:DEAD/DEAH box helicase n=1 Tax=Aerococcus kribbianus TaxID=2999064 RepID=A0A9X3JG32_9LACT|nr:MULTISPECIES: DEAD/DEAH box helicase [unclassified Aerococcus]MCZ0717622.1 DEAD/DEAH box helicase [Aerococcus sp. YH-aer221]MCZ0725910.1 DEAD/DEAH box helicase [Aerococcus sp. YH-aer222]
MERLEASLKKAFIDEKVMGSELDPSLIINQPHKKENLLNILQDDLDQCQSFIFSIAFLTTDGLDAIKVQLADLARRGIKGKLITSNYLSFNHPHVFLELLKIPNLEVRISNKEGFHSKGYLFQHDDYRSFIIGSSNLTMSALKMNYEWNIRLTSNDHGEIIRQMENHLAEEWQAAQPLNKEWIIAYQNNYQPLLRQELVKEEKINNRTEVKPNRMQRAALKELQALRTSGHNKGLVVSATGTGKTYLSAFDVKQAQPKRMLFVVHREQILEAALTSFRRVLGGPSEDYGILSGHLKQGDRKYVFATIQTISKPDYYERFSPDNFDYILIDEVHKAGAKSYQEIIDYFTPNFLLGMTATPERTDNFNIFELFDYNVAYEIRLQEALNQDLLCPFHYFGVTDYEKDGQVIDEASDLSQLVVPERVDFLLEKINYYGVSGLSAKGLVFCSRKDECKLLASAFNQRGIKSIALTGDDSIDAREQAVKALEKGEVSYLFTVDIFNEGIDIPTINQVVMLRNTKSSIIFTQQLGRGLRKHPSKDFVTVIDFIGNYSNNYMIPMALMGDNSHNRDNLRRETQESQFISGLSAINFESIAKERVFAAIDHFVPDSMEELRKAYKQLKNRLNRVPRLVDFKEQHSLDPYLIANKFNTYHDFLVKVKDNPGSLTEWENRQLQFLSVEILPGKRPHESLLLQYLLANQTISKEDLMDYYREAGVVASMAIVESVINTLTIDYYAGTMRQRYESVPFITVNNEELISLTDQTQMALSKSYYRELFVDVLKTSDYNNQDYQSDHLLSLYQKYRRRDVLRLLGWDKQMVDQNIGGYARDERLKRFVIFVTLEKGEDFTGAQIAYEDALINPVTMHWYSKAKRKVTSPEIKVLANSEDWEVLLFVKKSDNESNDFYYLGQVFPDQQSIQEETKPLGEGKTASIVSMNLKLKLPLPTRLYKYLTH